MAGIHENPLREKHYGNNKRLDFNQEAEEKVEKPHFTRSVIYEAFLFIRELRDLRNVGALIIFFSL